ncbi:hypothetical protein CRUP_001496 [Coryphaenoides rupestris]|nr:hypothetical protein CRUP_001496 [Coryphaenoides rupestris]
MELKLLVIGSNGPAQFQLTNGILGRQEFPKEVTGIPASRKSAGTLAGRRVCVVNGPNIYTKDLSEAKRQTELKRSKCLSSPGPHALLVAFDLKSISPNDTQTPGVVAQRFGVGCLHRCMVLLAYDGSMEGAALEDRVLRGDWHLRELVQKFGGRYHVFSKNWRDGRHQQELLQKVEWLVASGGGGFFSSRTFQRAEASVRKEEERIRRRRAAEVKKALKELEEQYGEAEQEEELQERRRAYDSAVGAEVRAQAELNNGWLRTSLARGLGAGLAVGVAMGALVGAVEGPGGAVVCGIIGGVVGGAAGGAAQVALENLEERVTPHTRLNFNSIFINRFFTAARR